MGIESYSQYFKSCLSYPNIFDIVFNTFVQGNVGSKYHEVQADKGGGQYTELPQATR